MSQPKKSPGSKLARLTSQIQRVKKENAQTSGHIASLLVATGTGAALGWVRGRYANETDGSLNIWKTQIDAEPVAAAALAVAVVMGWAGKYGEEVMSASAAIAAVYGSNLTEISGRKARLGGNK